MFANITKKTVKSLHVISISILTYNANYAQNGQKGNTYIINCHVDVLLFVESFNKYRSHYNVLSF